DNSGDRREVIVEKAKGRQDRRHWGRSVGIVAFFAATGPLAGLATFLVWFVRLGIVSGMPASNSDLAGGVLSLLKIAVIGMFFGLPNAYSIGFPAAAVVGLVAALWEWRFRTISWLAAGGAAFAVWLVPFLYSGDQFAADGIRLSRTSGMLPAYIGAAIICAWAGGRIVR